MKARVLVAPLNWGLGHAARCIPVIRLLDALGAKVVLASDGEALALLRHEFPALTAHALPGYGITYPRDGAMAPAMMRSAPRIAAAIRGERQATRRIVESEGIDAIVSDNRYGCFHPGIPAVVITHQVHIRPPAGWGWTRPVLNRLTRRLLGRFDAVWIPDVAVEPGLSGALSHPPLPSSAYCGPLSRFDALPPDPAMACDVLALCSGPEPQRSLFEALAVRQLAGKGIRATLVRGVVSEPPGPVQRDGITVHAWLPATELNRLVCSAAVVLCRPGYSTVMDLSRTGRRAIFIPTPGQTEQEYLADHLMSRSLFYSERQDAFDLVRALDRSAAYHGLHMPDTADLLLAAVDGLLRQVKG